MDNNSGFSKTTSISSSSSSSSYQQDIDNNSNSSTVLPTANSNFEKYYVEFIKVVSPNKQKIDRIQDILVLLFLF